MLVFFVFVRRHISGDLCDANIATEAWNPADRLDSDARAFALHKEAELDEAMRLLHVDNWRAAGEPLSLSPSYANTASPVATSGAVQLGNKTAKEAGAGRGCADAEVEKIKKAGMSKGASPDETLSPRQSRMGNRGSDDGKMEAGIDPSEEKKRPDRMDAQDMTAKMTTFYSILNPSKLCDVAKLTIKYRDNANGLNENLRLRYGGLDLRCSEKDIRTYARSQVRKGDVGIPTLAEDSILSNRGEISVQKRDGAHEVCYNGQSQRGRDGGYSDTTDLDHDDYNQQARANTGSTSQQQSNCMPREVIACQAVRRGSGNVVGNVIVEGRCAEPALSPRVLWHRDSTRTGIRQNPVRHAGVDNSSRNMETRFDSVRAMKVTTANAVVTKIEGEVGNQSADAYLHQGYGYVSGSEVEHKRDSSCSQRTDQEGGGRPSTACAPGK